MVLKIQCCIPALESISRASFTTRLHTRRGRMVDFIFNV
jgi:hypothetical protein